MSLITGILTVDLDSRFKISDIMAHPWYTAGDVYAPEGGATPADRVGPAPELPNANDRISRVRVDQMIAEAPLRSIAV